VVRSARPLSSAALLLAAATALAGCETTMQEAARIQINDARIRASEVGVRISHSIRTVSVTDVALVRGSHTTAFVVSIRNLSGAPTSDLAVSVGVRLADRKLVYANSTAGLPYFSTHIAEVGRRATLDWVFTTGRTFPSGSRPFARVGAAAVLSPEPHASPVPGVTGRLLAPPAGGAGGEAATVLVRNRSSMPQYQLPVYAYVRRGDRYLAAGVASIATLPSGSSATIKVPLAGHPAGGAITVEVPATIFA
jgi:hypothetical protein